MFRRLHREAAALHANTEFRPTLVVRVPWSPDRSDPSELLTAIPGLCLAAAGGPSDAAELLAAALDAGGTTVILEPGLALQGHQAELAASPRPLGQASVLRAGDHATLLCWGAGVGAASRAADVLSAEGIEVDEMDCFRDPSFAAAALSLAWLCGALPQGAFRFDVTRGGVNNALATVAKCGCLSVAAVVLLLSLRATAAGVPLSPQDAGFAAGILPIVGAWRYVRRPRRLTWLWDLALPLPLGALPVL